MDNDSPNPGHPARAVTMKDVAQTAQVALGTVSNYLNGTGPVAQDKADRIQRAIEQLGYRVNLGARGLRARRTDSVGLILPNVASPFHAEVAHAIEHALWKLGLQTLLCDSGSDPARERGHLTNLLERRVDGLLLIYSDETQVPAEAAAQLGVPVVFVDRGVEGFLSVTTDNWLGGALAARHLLDLGHRRFGLLCGQGSLKNVRDRVDGFTYELAKRGVRLDEEDILHGAQEPEFGAEVLSLMRRREPPTAVFATDDLIAIGAWQALLQGGWRVPQDVSLVGFDDIEVSRLLVPPLTTVAQDKAGLGFEAAALLQQVLFGRAAYLRSITIAPTLQVRGTTGPPPCPP